MKHAHQKEAFQLKAKTEFHVQQINKLYFLLSFFIITKRNHSIFSTHFVLEFFYRLSQFIPKIFRAV